MSMPLKRSVFLFCFLFVLPVSAQPAQGMLLLKTWQPAQDVRGWLMSEKLDGVRAYWDGQKLISRGGKIFSAPAWFIKDFPPFALDGELWSKRRDFENIVSIVRRKKPHSGWKQISYQIFDAPNQAGGLPGRLKMLDRYLSDQPSSYIRIIPQLPCHGKKHLQQYLQRLVSLGAEGLVVRNPEVPYQTGRSSDALKVKNYSDAECKITAYKPGKGKLKGLTGALLCRMDTGQEISIGSGLNQNLRTTPPDLGQVITFKYYGLTKNGKPRHPVFLRLRP
jgi:DNA ligase-1